MPPLADTSLELIAEYYDLLFGDFEEDVDMWLTLAGQVDGPLLEIGCGTGRLLLPMAQAGYSLTGIDLSSLALGAARAKLEAAGLTGQVTVIQADMRHFDLSRHDFALAFIPLNTFMHCQTMEEQQATLFSIHGHLRPGGRLILDLFYPEPTLLAEADGRLYFEAETIDEITGRTVQWYWRHDIDLARQLRHLTYILDEIDDEGLVRRVQIPFSLRFIYRYEMELLLRTSGFYLESLYGSYQLDPFDSHSPRLVVTARKA